MDFGQRILFCEIDSVDFTSFFGLEFFKLFPSSKVDFWPFLKLQKMEFGQKKFFREIDSVDFTSFFGLDFFKFYAPEIALFYVDFSPLCLYAK